jgi:hypothetical protein
MQVLQPKDISDSIMTIIDNAKEFVVMVSPQYNFYKWDTLLKRIEHAKKRSIKMSFWTKESIKNDNIKSLQEVERVGYHAKQIKHLNANIYFNEHQAIISSKSLLYNAENTVLDIALQTETEEEYDTIMSFYKKHIKIEGENLLFDTNVFLEDIDTALTEIFQKNVRLQYDETTIQINAKGRYKVSIVKEKTNCLKISCILSEEEFAFAKANLSNFNRGNFSITLEEGVERYHSFIWGTIGKLRTSSIDKILDVEADELKQNIVHFVLAVKELKDYVYNQSQNG